PGPARQDACPRCPALGGVRGRRCRAAVGGEGRQRCPAAPAGPQGRGHRHAPGRGRAPALRRQHGAPGGQRPAHHALGAGERAAAGGGGPGGKKQALGMNDRRSLGNVHSSVSLPKAKGWRRILAFLGPAYLVSVGYMDPGNWATDIAGGSAFGYQLIWVLLMSNLMALLLQSL